LQREIVGILKGSGAIKEAVLFSELEILGDAAMQELVRRELEDLEGTGLVRKSCRGWKCVR
jgi:hypothetical protein